MDDPSKTSFPFHRRARRLRPTAVFLVLLVASPALSAGTDLSLEQAIRLGRTEAREVAAAEARLAAGQARADLARGFRKGTLSLSEVWVRTDSPAEVFALELSQERFSFSDFVAGDPNHPDALESATTRLQLDVPLYTAGELGSRVEQASLEAEALADDLGTAGDRAGLAAGEAWIRLAEARERVALIERSLDTVKAHAHRAGLLVEQGMAVESDRLRAEVEMARVADLLSAARSGNRVAQAQLSFVLNRPLDTAWSLTPLAEPPELPQIQDLLRSADDRTDLAAARRRLSIAQLEEKVARSARLPRAGFVARYDLVDDTPFGAEGNHTSLMVQARVDLWTGGRHRAAVAAAGADAERAAHEVEAFAAGVRLAVLAAHSEATSARERYATALAAQAAARENERILKARFQQGVAPLLDLLDATSARREAEARELIARADSHRTVLRLWVSAGRTLDRWRLINPDAEPDPAPRPMAGSAHPSTALGDIPTDTPKSETSTELRGERP